LRTGQTLLVVAIAALAAMAPSASAHGAGPFHTELTASYPAADSVHTAEIYQIRLRFSTEVQPTLSAITLIGPAGAVAVSTLAAVPGSESTEVRVGLDAPLPTGDYTVEWRTAGPDSHVIRGTYAFSVVLPEPVPGASDEAQRDPEGPLGAEAPGASGQEPAAPTFQDNPPSAGSTVEGPYGAGALVVGWLFFASVLGMVGSVAFRLVVPARLSCEPHTAARVRAGMVGFAWVVLALGALSVPARMVLQAGLVAGPDGSALSAAGRLLGAGWGVGWFIELSAVALFGIGLLLTRRDRAGVRPWLVAGAGALLAASVPALSGHAAASGPAIVVLDSIHVLAAGVWVGGLACLLAVGIPASAGGGEPTALASTVRGFSSIALPAVGILVLSGVVNTVLHLSLPDLLQTHYGRILVLKALVAALAFVIGFYNWRVVQPSLETDPRASLLRIPAAVELAAGLAVLAVTAALVVTARP
jgi:putative copper export protein/methionine-rich copper-binding protein CopC